MNIDGKVGLYTAMDQGDAQDNVGFIDLRGIFATVWQRKWMIALVTMLFTGLAVVMLQRMTPIYSALTQVMLNTRETNVVNFESVLSGLPSDAKFIEGEVAVITSNQLLERVVKQLRLERDPEFNSALRPSPVYREWIASIKSELPEDLRLALGMSDQAKFVDPVLQQESQRKSSGSSDLMDAIHSRS